MDDDHDRASSQFKNAICLLQNGLQKRNLRIAIWRDSRIDPRGLVFNEKHSLIENERPRDIVKMLWGYEGVGDTETISRIASKGFEIWGAPGERPEVIRQWRENHCKNSCDGIVMTKWVPCTPQHELEIISMIQSKSDLYFKDI